MLLSPALLPLIFFFKRTQSKGPWEVENEYKLAAARSQDAPLASLFPPEPGAPRPGAPKLRVAILGAGLAGMSTAIELLDQGHSVELYESRSFIGGKVASYKDRGGNHVEMGLHVFFGCYFNLFRLMAKASLNRRLTALRR